jgi:predicted esterase
MKKACLISLLMVICSLSGCTDTDLGSEGVTIVGPEEIEPEPVDDEPEPVDDEPEPVDDEPEPVDDEPEPVDDEPEPGPINIPPCSTIASEGLNHTSNPSDWPVIRNGQWIAIDGLTNVSYASIELDNDSDVVVDQRLDWMCGYTYSVKVPGGYNASNQYPVFLYLHGQLEDSVFFNNMLTNNFHIPEDDKYIIVRPSKLEWDWDPKKALDVLEDVKSHLSVDDDRVYLTGLSMGGRGTFIVAAALPDYFAAIMPLSPHHEPYSYLSLAEEVAHIPIWMSHGTADNTSSYEMAEQMAENLTKLGAEIEFHPVVDGGHYIWFAIYTDHSAMQWMLSHVRGQ